jgi:hypothetical protein
VEVHEVYSVDDKGSGGVEVSTSKMDGHPPGVFVSGPNCG